MKFKFNKYYNIPLDFNDWSKEEQEKYLKIGIEDGWLCLPFSFDKIIKKLKNFRSYFNNNGK